MILEQIGKIVDGQTLTAGADQVSENSLDLETVFGENPIAMPWLVGSVQAAVGALDSETYQVQLVVDRHKDLATDPKVILETPAMANDDPRINAAGAYFWRGTLPYEIFAWRSEHPTYDYRYMGFRFTLVDGGGTASAKFDITLSPTQPPSDVNVQRIESPVDSVI